MREGRRGEARVKEEEGVMGRKERGYSKLWKEGNGDEREGVGRKQDREKGWWF